MEWSKIKNIILLILLILNGILLVMTAQQEHQQRLDEASALTQVLESLEANGISVSPSVLPEETPLPTLLVDRENMQTGPEQAETLLGPCSRKDESGGVRVTYTSASGRLETFSNGRFSAELTPGLFPTGTSDPLVHALEMLKLLGVTAELTAREQKDDSDVLTFRQVWEGAPVFNCEITLSYQAGSLYRIEGQRLFGSASASGTPEMVNLPTLLIRFLGQRNESGRMFSEIRSISAGYQYSGSRPYTLTPVWYVETDTGPYTLSGADGTVQ